MSKIDENLTELGKTIAEGTERLHEGLVERAGKYAHKNASEAVEEVLKEAKKLSKRKAFKIYKKTYKEALEEFLEKMQEIQTEAWEKTLEESKKWDKKREARKKAREPDEYVVVYNSEGNPVSGEVYNKANGISRRIYEAKQKIENTQGEEKKKWIKVRRHWNEQAIKLQEQYPQFRIIRTK